MLKLRLVPAGVGSQTPVSPETGTGLYALGGGYRYSGPLRHAPVRRWLTLALRTPVIPIEPDESPSPQGDPYPILFI